jgi:phospholipase/carboxylesterase
MSISAFRERRADGVPQGLLVLHHGRGADEHDLLPLADVLDPDRRLHVVTPRAPLQLQGWPGYHWYVVPRVGYPDPATFHPAYEQLGAFHDALWAQTGFVPVVDGWELDLAGRSSTRFFVAHGRSDPVIEVGFGRRARDLLESGGLDVEYHESDAAHEIDPAHVPEAVAWLRDVV